MWLNVWLWVNRGNSKIRLQTTTPRIKEKGFHSSFSILFFTAGGAADFGGSHQCGHCCHAARGCDLGDHRVREPLLSPGGLDPIHVGGGAMLHSHPCHQEPEQAADHIDQFLTNFRYGEEPSLGKWKMSKNVKSWQGACREDAARGRCPPHARLSGRPSRARAPTGARARPGGRSAPSGPCGHR